MLQYRLSTLPQVVARVPLAVAVEKQEPGQNGANIALRLASAWK